MPLIISSSCLPLMHTTKVNTQDSQCSVENNNSKMTCSENSTLCRKKNCVTPDQHSESVIHLNDYRTYFDLDILYCFYFHIKIHRINYKDYFWKKFNGESIGKNLIQNFMIHDGFLQSKQRQKTLKLSIK